MRVDTGAAGTERFFTGQVEDADASLYYYNARYLSTGIGRFISPDSIVPNPSDPRDHNRYAYVRNNPLKYTDPSGYYTCAYGESGSYCDDWTPPELNDSQVFEERAQLILNGDRDTGGVRDPYFSIDTDYAAIEAAKYFRPRSGESSVMLMDGAYLGIAVGGAGAGNTVVVDTEGNVDRGSYTFVDVKNAGVVPFEEERIIRRHPLTITNVAQLPADTTRFELSRNPLICLACISGIFDDSNRFALNIAGNVGRFGKGNISLSGVLGLLPSAGSWHFYNMRSIR